MFILLPLFLTGLAAIGLPKIEYEDDFLDMWLPKDNYYRLDSGMSGQLEKDGGFRFQMYVQLSEWYHEMRKTLNAGWGGGVSWSYPRDNHILVRSATTDEPRSVLSADLVKKLQVIL